jgi:glycerol uptake facilitator protein
VKNARLFAGELIGTFIMCFAGIGAVATATLYSALTGPGQVGLVWGIAIALGIYVTRNLSDAHFNPAVTFAMCINKVTPWREFPIYLLGQLVGAFLAAGALWGLFADSVAKNLENAGLTMASNSIGSAASIWCEIFPNTTNGSVTYLTGMFAEAMGVFVLVMVIFCVTSKNNPGRPSDAVAPLFIGLTITIMINVIGPITDAGLNPARDLMPRVWACIVGWGPIAFGTNLFETAMVYWVGPLLGGLVAALLYRFVIDPLYVKHNEEILAEGQPAREKDIEGSAARRLEGNESLA